MTVNLSGAARSFQAITNSLNEDLENHFYMSIKKDNQNRMTIVMTSNRNNRASLSEINEFANLCFQQYNAEDVEAFDNLKKIQTGLQTIREKISNSDRGCCGLGHLWFMIKRGASILASTDEIILRISNLTKIIVSSSTDVSEEENQNEVDVTSKIATPRKEEVKEEKIEEPAKITISEIDSILANAQLAEKKGKEYESTASYWNFMASQWYEKEGHEELAFEYLKKSCEKGPRNSEATTRLAKCYENGELGQKPNPGEACQYYLHAATINRTNYRNEACSSQCQKAFEIAPKKTLIYILEKFENIDILTLFTKDQILQAKLLPELEKFYLGNYEAEDNFKMISSYVLKQCKSVLRFGSLKAVIIIVEKLHEDLTKLVADQKERATLYFEAGELRFVQEGMNNNHYGSFKLYTKAAEEGSFESMLKLAEIEKDNQYPQWSIKVAEIYEKEGNFEKALYYYQIATKQKENALKACLKLVDYYENGRLGVEKNLALAAKYHYDAAAIYESAKQEDLAIEQLVLSVKLGSLGAAYKIIDTKGGLKAVIESPEERIEIFMKLAEKHPKDFHFWHDTVVEDDAIGAIELVGHKYSELGHDDLAGKMRLKAAQLYEQMNQNQKAFDIYVNLATNFSTLEAFERLALCFENGELGQGIDLDKAAGYYYSIAETYERQIDTSKVEKDLLERKSLQAYLKAFSLNSMPALEYLANKSVSLTFNQRFSLSDKALVAKKINKLQGTLLGEHERMLDTLKENLELGIIF